MSVYLSRRLFLFRRGNWTIYFPASRWFGCAGMPWFRSWFAFKIGLEQRLPAPPQEPTPHEG